MINRLISVHGNGYVLRLRSRSLRLRGDMLFSWPLSYHILIADIHTPAWLGKLEDFLKHPHGLTYFNLERTL